MTNILTGSLVKYLSVVYRLSYGFSRLYNSRFTKADMSSYTKMQIILIGTNLQILQTERISADIDVLLKNTDRQVTSYKNYSEFRA